MIHCSLKIMPPSFVHGVYQPLSTLPTHINHAHELAARNLIFTNSCSVQSQVQNVSDKLSASMVTGPIGADMGMHTTSTADNPL